MPAIEKGRTCVITQGGDAGKKVVIKEVVDKNFVIISGEHVKERRSNVRHLEPISEILSTVKTKVTKQKAKKEKLRKTKKVKPKTAKKEKKKAAAKEKKEKPAKKAKE